MNTFRVDGLTRALARQLQIADFLCFSLGFIGFLSFLGFSLVFLLNREYPISPFWGPPGVRSAPYERVGPPPRRQLQWAPKEML